LSSSGCPARTPKRSPRAPVCMSSVTRWVWLEVLSGFANASEAREATIHIRRPEQAIHPHRARAGRVYHSRYPDARLAEPSGIWGAPPPRLRTSGGRSRPNHPQPGGSRGHEQPRLLPATLQRLCWGTTTEGAKSNEVKQNKQKDTENHIEIRYLREHRPASLDLA
jgi:hypothetical protein